MQRFLVILLLFPSFCFGQNLVPNPSFEVNDSCPIAGSGACPFFFDEVIKTIPPWHLPTCGSADYLNQCNPNTFTMGVPENALGYQPARTGVAYTGMYVYFFSTEYREYIARPLDTALEAGNKYYAEMYVSAANKDTLGSCPTDGIGMYFSIGVPDTTGVYFGVLAVSPQVENPSGNILTDTVNWMKVSGSFIATGGENYITIGNFRPDINIQGCLTGNSYYYVDDICVSADSTYCSPEAEGVIEAEENTGSKIYPNPTTGIFTVQGTVSPIQVYDLFGRLVLRTNKEQVDMSSYPAGIYMVRAGEAVRKLILH